MVRWVLTGLLVADVDVESEDDEQSDQSRPPVDDKHHHAAQDRSGERHPHVVVFETGAPPWCHRQDRNRGDDGRIFVTPSRT